MNSKKILHITTSDVGGAGIAAYRAHLCMREDGIDSRILVLSNPSHHNEFISSVISHDIRRGINFINRKLSRFVPVLREFNDVKRFPGEYEVLSTSKTIYKVENHPWVKEADIIHFHWISNFINFKSFFKSLGHKKFVWTLHDMNPFLGCFHYEGDLTRNQHLSELELKHRRIKKNALSNIADENLKVIFLNRWMEGKAKLTDTLTRFKSVVIPNCIDFNIFKRYDSQNVRNELGLDKSEFVLLFASQNLTNYRKGFDILIESLKLLSNEEVKITLLTFGESSDIFNEFDFKVINMGTTTDKEFMAKLYSSANAFLLPSREDNLPNVMLESWACGTPIVSFSNGGMQEYVESGLNGELVIDQTAESFKDGILKIYNGSYNSDRICEFAKLNFSPDVIKSKIVTEVYDRLES